MLFNDENNAIGFRIVHLEWKEIMLDKFHYFLIETLIKYLHLKSGLAKEALKI